MTNLDLRSQPITLDELLGLALQGGVRITNSAGQTFVLEEEDDFDREVALLGKSEKFKKFLDERSGESSTTSLEDYRRSLDSD